MGYLEERLLGFLYFFLGPLVTVSCNPADSRATEAEELKMKCAST